MTEQDSKYEPDMAYWIGIKFLFWLLLALALSIWMFNLVEEGRQSTLDNVGQRIRWGGWVGGFAWWNAFRQGRRLFNAREAFASRRDAGQAVKSAKKKSYALVLRPFGADGSIEVSPEVSSFQPAQ